MKKALLPRQVKFVEEYVACLNGAEAYRRAGYKMSGAYSNAHFLLSNPQIRAEIDRRIGAQTRMPASEILARLERQAGASIAMFLKPGTLIIDAAAVHEHGDLIQRFAQTAEGPRIYLHDSQKALELLGKSRALFVERTLIKDLEGMDIVEDETPEDPHSRGARSPGRD